ncbi:hypothetical protein F66182_9610 [Fusarium sp. NRRL 66182]|nr:hypothetical protein F66182_9610 [Fusarium sp. NRRL 66182]
MIETTNDRGPTGTQRALELAQTHSSVSACRAVLSETLVRDIPATEYHIYLYNDVDAPDWNHLPVIRRPNWSSGNQNAFFPHTNYMSHFWNHYHAVVGMGIPFRLDRPGTEVELRMGNGGRGSDWQVGGLYSSLQPFPERIYRTMVPFSTAICIKIMFEIDGVEEDSSLGLEVPQVENVSMGDDAVVPQAWCDTFRFEIRQQHHPHIISLNMRFVDTQNPDPMVGGTTSAELFNIRGIAADDERVELLNGRMVTVQPILIKLERDQNWQDIEPEAE